MNRFMQAVKLEVRDFWYEVGPYGVTKIGVKYKEEGKSTRKIVADLDWDHGLWFSTRNAETMPVEIRDFMFLLADEVRKARDNER